MRYLVLLLTSFFFLTHGVSTATPKRDAPSSCLVSASRKRSLLGLATVVVAACGGAYCYLPCHKRPNTPAVGTAQAVTPASIEPLRQLMQNAIPPHEGEIEGCLKDLIVAIKKDPALATEPARLRNACISLLQERGLDLTVCVKDYPHSFIVGVEQFLPNKEALPLAAALLALLGELLDNEAKKAYWAHSFLSYSFPYEQHTALSYCLREGEKTKLERCLPYLNLLLEHGSNPEQKVERQVSELQKNPAKRRRRTIKLKVASSLQERSVIELARALRIPDRTTGDWYIDIYQSETGAWNARKMPAQSMEA